VKSVVVSAVEDVAKSEIRTINLHVITIPILIRFVVEDCNDVVKIDDLFSIR